VAALIARSVEQFQTAAQPSQSNFHRIDTTRNLEDVLGSPHFNNIDLVTTFKHFAFHTIETYVLSGKAILRAPGDVLRPVAETEYTSRKESL
jgi:hypothetical protein